MALANNSSLPWAYQEGDVRRSPGAPSFTPERYPLSYDSGAFQSEEWGVHAPVLPLQEWLRPRVEVVVQQRRVEPFVELVSRMSPRSRRDGPQVVGRSPQANTEVNGLEVHEFQVEEAVAPGQPAVDTGVQVLVSVRRGVSVQLSSVPFPPTPPLAPASGARPWRTSVPPARTSESRQPSVTDGREGERGRRGRGGAAESERLFAAGRDVRPRGSFSRLRPHGWRWELQSSAHYTPRILHP